MRQVKSASEVLVTLESVVNSIAVVIDKSLEGNGRTTDVGCCQGVLTVLSRRLALSAQKLLVHDPGREDTEKGQKNKVSSPFMQKYEYTRDHSWVPNSISDYVPYMVPCTGNLKHKDLYGQVVSSQVYHNGEDEMGQREQNQMEDEDEENNVTGAESPMEVEHDDGQGDGEN
ncbi:hypothetical protein BHM03_00022769 [Ensete ventricosum]|nr:hypothetical protein BHM03_00022769 [Ensete ventricosum]